MFLEDSDMYKQYYRYRIKVDIGKQSTHCTYQRCSICLNTNEVVYMKTILSPEPFA